MKKSLFLVATLIVTCLLLSAEKNTLMQSLNERPYEVKCDTCTQFECDTSVRFKLVLCKNPMDFQSSVEYIVTVNSARFTRAFQKLYGDSLLYQAVERGEWCGLSFFVNWDGSIDIIRNTTNFRFRQSSIYKFVMKHLRDIVKETISMYDYLYVLTLEESYLKEINSRNGLLISANIPIGMLTFPFFRTLSKKDPKSFFDELYSYEFAPLRTSIDEGIYPEDYKRLHDEAVMRDSLLKINNSDAHPLDSIQQRKEAAKQDTATTPSSDNPKEIIFF